MTLVGVFLILRELALLFLNALTQLALVTASMVTGAAATPSPFTGWPVTFSLITQVISIAVFPLPFAPVGVYAALGSQVAGVSTAGVCILADKRLRLTASRDLGIYCWGSAKNSASEGKV